MQPESRLLLLLMVSLQSLLIDNLLTLLCVYLVVLAVFLFSGAGLKKAGILLAISLIAIWGFVVTQAFFYPFRPRTELMEIISPSSPFLGAITGGVAIYWEGVLYGVIQSLRFLIMITSGLTIVWNSSPRKMLIGLRRLGLPYKVSFMLSTAIRFIPSIANEVKMVLDSMKIRGFPLSPLKPWNYLIAISRGMMPILHRNLRRASLLADSVESRGFAIRNDVDFGESEEGFFGKLIILTVSLLLSATIIFKLITFFAFSDIYYSEGFRWIYAFVETWL